MDFLNFMAEFYDLIMFLSGQTRNDIRDGLLDITTTNWPICGLQKTHKMLNVIQTSV